MSRSLAKWDQKIQRAAELAAAHPYAAEGLRFYERIAGFQKSLYGELAAGPPGTLRDHLEPIRLLPWFGSFLSFVQDVAPPLLAQSAAALRAAGGARWEELLDDFWKAPDAASLTEPESLLAWIFLQPYAESIADRT